MGSSAIKGSGFDIIKQDSWIIAALASGHGENIIEQQITSNAVGEIRNNYHIGDTKEFLKDAIDWDLGLIMLQFEQEKNNG